ncbi:SRPBCC domain-containing protein [uncultured Flavobacterium sp.]|uniref:SRPBCC domain-containing protein n=1 Tax=uncultured Flavobacterium sp. TaxID=165435 RepID=UPI0030EE03E6|tara:strand:- start:34395 stop:34874 length:480 start_codon:yes stop_codon:yes gene_type:complete
MTTEKLEIEVAMQIQKPVHQVFDAIINPDTMSYYFISKSTGMMDEGSELIWNFPEFEMDCPVRVGKIIKDEYISFYWLVDEIELLVEMTLTEKENNSTLVTITEKSRDNDLKGLKWLSGNSFGWANFLTCLKGYLEYRIKLRKGAFDFMREENQCSFEK